MYKVSSLVDSNKEVVSRNFKEHKISFFVLFLVLIVFVTSLYITYKYVLISFYDTFLFQPTIGRVAVSSLAILILFLLLDHYGRKTSTFLFKIYYNIMLIPISVVFGCAGMGHAYYGVIMLSSIIGLLFVNCSYDEGISEERNDQHLSIRAIENSNHFFVIVSLFAVVVVLAISFYTYGPPQLTALDLGKVYELRANNTYIVNKYFGYFFKWTQVTLLPFLMGLFLCRRRPFLAVTCGTILVLLFLYTGEKTILFSIPMIFMVFVISRFKYSNYYLDFLLQMGYIGVNLMGLIGIVSFYDYLTRRILILPAYLKFLYYDFFSTHERIGLAGTLWGSGLSQQSPYDTGLGHVIGSYYYHNDAINSNTGFLAEGYYRFGMRGVVIIIAIFILLLKVIDWFGQRNSFSLAVTVCSYPIFMLNDGALIDSMIFGPLTVLIMILLFFTEGGLREKNVNREIVLLYK